jgi:membrane fusion protein, multidrug efflux system
MEQTPETDPKKYEGPRPSRFFVNLLLAGAIIIVVLTAGLVLGHDVILQRQSSQLEQRVEQGRRVLVEQVGQMGGKRTLEFPAAIHGYIETPVYAKIAGYLAAIKVDKGDRVHKGELMALLTSPELDRQVADAKANYWLQKVTDERNQSLLRQGVIAQQTADQSHSSMEQALEAYQQLVATQAYEKITAPFDGIVTARYVDPGVLIPESTTPQNEQPIIALATLHPLRVYANLPQDMAVFVRDGDPAKIKLYERPGRIYSGPIIRHPDALDSQSRTMLVEVDLPNDDASLLPGMYARMDVTVTGAKFGTTVRDDALIFREGKVYVPVVINDHIRLVPVELGYDNGLTIQVVGDIHDEDMIALNLGQDVEDGEVVQPVRSDAQSN